MLALLWLKRLFGNVCLARDVLNIQPASSITFNSLAPIAVVAFFRVESSLIMATFRLSG